jgi:hypothetical protein
VLGGGFGLWLGDNIAILSMVKRAHPLYSNICPYNKKSNISKLTTNLEKKILYFFKNF